MTPIESFREAMGGAGLKYDGQIKEDSALHRFRLDGDRDDSCWYKFNPDGIPAGAFGCWRRGISEKWHFKDGKKLAPAEYAEVQKRWREDEAQRLKEEQERWSRMSDKAVLFCSSAVMATGDHPYLKSKSVQAHGELRQSGSDLIIPLADVDGKVWSYQTIDADGAKLFMPGGRVRSCFFWLHNNKGPLVICEGYATGASIFEATGYSVACCMNCGNMVDVSRALRAKFKERIIIIASDDDRFTKKGNEPYNPGLDKATEAARATGSFLAVPKFPTDSQGTDFNDLVLESSPGSVRGYFESLIGIGMGRQVKLADLLAFVPSEDPDSRIGNRYLCCGGSCVIVAQTSAGKSSLGMQMAIMWALGMPFFGIKPSRPLKSLIVQAENDDGDTAEMFQGILLGLGLVSNDSDPATHIDIIKRLQKNLIIVRDQTHIGMNFPPYASSLCEIHQPDLFWTDPFLSFYGDDINDQKAMSRFLRADLNPISEKNGVIWMMLHHTGKPAKDAKKSQKGWSSRDFSYMGIGSSELSNWARAIMCLTATTEDEFRLVLAKRGWRAGVVDDGGAPSTEINLAYSTDHICWRRIPKPSENGEMDSKLMEFVRSITSPMKSTDIVKLAANRLQRGIRTCWTMWGSGEGELGALFRRDSDSMWVPKSGSKSTPNPPYKED